MKRNGVRPSVCPSVPIRSLQQRMAGLLLCMGRPGTSIACCSGRRRGTPAVPRSVAPPGFCNKGEVRYGSIGGLQYEVPQSVLYCLCINVALCSTALQCICRVIRRSSMTMKAHTYYIIFGRPPIGGSFPPPGGATGHVVSVRRLSRTWLSCFLFNYCILPFSVKNKRCTSLT